MQWWQFLRSVRGLGATRSRCHSSTQSRRSQGHFEYLSKITREAITTNIHFLCLSGLPSCSSHRKHLFSFLSLWSPSGLRIPSFLPRPGLPPSLNAPVRRLVPGLGGSSVLPCLASMHKVQGLVLQEGNTHTQSPPSKDPPTLSHKHGFSLIIPRQFIKYPPFSRL